MTDDASPAGTPIDSSSSPRNRRLFHHITGMFRRRNASTASCISSASASGPANADDIGIALQKFPQPSPFHRPVAEHFADLIPFVRQLSPGFMAMTLANGIVRS